MQLRDEGVRWSRYNPNVYDLNPIKRTLPKTGGELYTIVEPRLRYNNDLVCDWRASQNFTSGIFGDQSSVELNDDYLAGRRDLVKFDLRFSTETHSIGRTMVNIIQGVQLGCVGQPHETRRRKGVVLP